MPWKELHRGPIQIMIIAQRDINEAFDEYSGRYGGLVEDYFGFLYLKNRFGLDIEDAAKQVAFGGNDYGVDGFHFDREAKTLYLFQFKWSDDHRLFEPSMKRLYKEGLDWIFSDRSFDSRVNQVLRRLKSTLFEQSQLIHQVIVEFVFKGDTEAAERSRLLLKLVEDLDSRKYIIDQFLGHGVRLMIQFVSTGTDSIGRQVVQPSTYEYDIPMDDCIRIDSEDNAFILAGFIPLTSLRKMHQEMGSRFLERNIRAGLSEDIPANLALFNSLKRTVIDGFQRPDHFAFLHNGIAISAVAADHNNKHLHIKEPRLINGAQTLVSLNRFMNKHEFHPKLKEGQKRLEDIRVFAKVICSQSNDFVTEVTIANNRQTPVNPWNLRANDDIQLKLQDKFAGEAGIYYERQEAMQQTLRESEVHELRINPANSKAIQIQPLARTFLATQGEIGKMSRMPEVFEDKRTYDNTFRTSYLKTDVKKIVLAYKVGLRMRMMMREVTNALPQSYQYLTRGKNAVWALTIQGIFNHPDFATYCQDFGADMSVPSDFTDIMISLVKKVADIIKATTREEAEYTERARNLNYEFLRNKRFFEDCMKRAEQRYDWKKKSL